LAQNGTVPPRPDWIGTIGISASLRKRIA